MVGVKMKALTNCDELQDKVEKIIGPWKSGKFMPLAQRTHSINLY
jgi:hypothetical protein